MEESEKFERFIRTAYGPRFRVGFDTDGPSMAHQSFKAECDINTIMARYQKSGLLTHVNEHRGDYGQFIGFQDYHSAMNAILDAEHAFASLPASLRRRFDHDPAEFLRFVHDPANGEEMISLGLAVRRPTEVAGEPDHHGGPVSEPSEEGS